MAGDIKSTPWIWYSQSSSGYCLSLCFVWGVCVLCVCICVLEGYTGTVTGFSTSCSLRCPPPFPFLPPLPSYQSLLSCDTPPPPSPCPYWLDNTKPLYATCPSARLHLREPLSLSSELPLAAFVWILVKPPPPPPPPPPLSPSPCSPLFLSHSVLLSFAPRAVLYKHRHTERHTHTD